MEEIETRRPKRKLKKWSEIVAVVLMSLALAFCVIEAKGMMRASGVLWMNIVSGQSMQPNFHTGDFVFVTNLEEIQRYDIVTATTPNETEVIKRVIGMPGDTITYKGRHIYVNGKLSDESFINNPDDNATTTDYLQGELTLGDGEYFLAGDNRENSSDSRIYGAVERSAIHGKVIAKS